MALVCAIGYCKLLHLKKHIMARFITQNQSDIGLSPFELKFKGKKRSEKTHMKIMDFSPDKLIELKLKDIKEAIPFNETNTVSWLNIDGLHDENLIAQVGETFDLDRMVLSDVLNPSIRPKVVEYDNCLFISMKMMRYEEAKNRLHMENLSLVIADRILISFQETKGDVFEPVRDRIRNGKKKIRNSGSDYLAFALLDIVIDNYIYILSLLGDRIESLEDSLLPEPGKHALSQINAFKREMNYLRKNIIPAKEMISSLVKLDSDFLDFDAVGVHYKELQDNINQAVETSDSYREILSDQLNIYHTTVSSKLNDIMRFLTIFSVIFIPLTFIAGIYGTNFDNLPELHYEYSYYVMLAVMLFLTMGMIAYFRRKGWM